MRLNKSIKLLKILKSLFVNDDISLAFDIELKKFLEKIDPKDIPDNLTSFYYTNFKIKQKSKDKIKFRLHFMENQLRKVKVWSNCVKLFRKGQGCRKKCVFF